MGERKWEEEGREGIGRGGEGKKHLSFRRTCANMPIHIHAHISRGVISPCPDNDPRFPGRHSQSRDPFRTITSTA